METGSKGIPESYRRYSLGGLLVGAAIGVVLGIMSGHYGVAVGTCAGVGLMAGLGLAKVMSE